MPHRLDEKLVRFIRAHIGSVWALELLLLMMRTPDREWSVDELVRDMRATEPLVSSLLKRFQTAGMLVRREGDGWTWRPVDEEIIRLSRQLAEAYAATPFAVIQVIAESPVSQLIDFADAFRVRKD